MISNSWHNYQGRDSHYDESLNPYTVLQRHPSQEYIYEDDLEVHQPIDDLKSIGNPYSHLPNYTTPSQYFSHLMNDNKSSNSLANLLTSTDTVRLANPFTLTYSNNYIANVNAPNNVTLNKHALSAQSVEDINSLNVQFLYKGAPLLSSAKQARSTETLNKKMLTSDSLYDLENVDVTFEDKQFNLGSLETNLLKIREFSTQSLADLRELPNLSQYSNFNDYGPSKDVETCIGISRASSVRLVNRKLQCNPIRSTL